MNFGFLDYFLFMFGIPPEGVDNPLMVMINFEEEIVAAQGLTAFGQDPDIYVADPSDVASSVSFDMDEQTLIITELSLMDSAGTAVLSLNGTIEPDMIDLVAGVSTEIPGLDLEILEEESEAPELYLVFHEDSTGMGIEIEEKEVGGVKLSTIIVPFPPDVPGEISAIINPTLFQSGGYLVLTSSAVLARNMIAVQKGESAGLRATAEFKKLSRGMDLSLIHI